MANDKKYKFGSSSGGEGTKTMVIIAVLVVLILIVGGGLISVIMHRGSAPPPTQNTTPVTNQTAPPPQKNVTNSTIAPPANQTNTTPACSDQCHLGNAIQHANVSECYMISDNTTAQSCFLELSNQSLEACKSLEATAAKTACITKFALSGNDTALCGLLEPVAQDSCLAALSPCNAAPDKELCQAISAKDPGKCAANNTCIIDYSVSMKDASACSNITDAVMSAACVSATLGLDKCHDLSLIAQQDYCYDLYAIASDNQLICTEMDNSFPRYSLDCYSHFAVETGNYSVCNHLMFDLDALWQCYTNYSLLSGDMSGCAQIDPLATTNRFACSFQFAEKYGDPTACQLINDTLVQRDTCYEGAILYNNTNLNWSKCAGVINYEWHNQCYSESARLYDNESLCSMIDDLNVQQSCMNSFAIAKANSTSG